MGIILLRLRLDASTAPTIAARPAPTPITRRGISVSHCPEGDVTVPFVAVEIEVVCVLVSLVSVTLLVVAVYAVIVPGT